LGELVRQAVIAAPVEAIFDFASDPYNAPSYISSIISVSSGPKEDFQPGQSWQARANFLGQPADITLRLTRLLRPHAIEFALIGDPAATLTLHFHPSPRPRETGVSLTLKVPSVPSLLLQALMGSLLSADMTRLKSRMERPLSK